MGSVRLGVREKLKYVFPHCGVMYSSSSRLLGVMGVTNCNVSFWDVRVDILDEIGLDPETCRRDDVFLHTIYTIYF